MAVPARRRTDDNVFAAILGLGAVGVLAFIAALLAWLTHIVVAIAALTSPVTNTFAYCVLLVLGVFVPPVGMIHGFGVWFGAW